MSHLNIARLPENLTQMLRHSVNCSLSQCFYFGTRLTFEVQWAGQDIGSVQTFGSDQEEATVLMESLAFTLQMLNEK